MLDKPAKRPRGRPRKLSAADIPRKQRMTLAAARDARENSDRFFALCGVSLQWQEEHGAPAVAVINKQ